MTDCLCQAGYTPSEEDCVPCPVGGAKHIMSNQTCVQCPAFSSLLSQYAHNIESCVCDAGYYDTGSCTPCAEGSFKSVYGDQACISCGIHTTGPTGATNKTQCLCIQDYEAGLNHGPDVEGGSCVESCGPGQRGEAGICVSCESGSYKAGFGQTCGQCDSPRIASPPAATSQTQCTCPEGKMGILSSDFVVVESIGDFSPVSPEITEIMSVDGVFTKAATTSNRWWKFSITESVPTYLVAKVNGVVVYECVEHNCMSLEIDITGTRGRLDITWVGATTKISVFEFTRRVVHVPTQPAWWDQPLVENWALQGLLHAGEAVFRTNALFSDSSCEACPAVLVCAAHV